MHMILPPLLKWNKTTDDLDSGEFSRWAQDYERSLLPHDIVFPRTSQIWEALLDCDVGFSAFFTGSPFERVWVPGKRPADFVGPLPFGRAQLSRGERVRIEPTADAKPVVVWFRPLRYRELPESIMPEDIQKIPRYSHYTLALRLARTSCCWQEEPTYFTEAFRLIEDLV